jgi:hypothetical protein
MITCQAELFPKEVIPTVSLSRSLSLAFDFLLSSTQTFKPWMKEDVSLSILPSSSILAIIHPEVVAKSIESKITTTGSTN